MASASAGLEGIVATTSKICFIDGDKGTLSYFGYNIHTLAENASFEEVIYLLWNGKLPNKSQLQTLRAALVAERELPSEVTAFLKAAPEGSSPMDVLRTAVSMLSLYDPLAANNSQEANEKKAVKLMAQTATIVTSFDRLRKGQAVVAGDPKLGFAANFLYTLTGKKPDEVMERVFDIALDPARRARAERVDVRRARHGGDAFRYLFRRHRGDRRAAGSAARRRQ